MKGHTITNIYLDRRSKADIHDRLLMCLDNVVTAVREYHEYQKGGPNYDFHLSEVEEHLKFLSINTQHIERVLTEGAFKQKPGRKAKHE